MADSDPPFPPNGPGIPIIKSDADSDERKPFGQGGSSSGASNSSLFYTGGRYETVHKPKNSGTSSRYADSSGYEGGKPLSAGMYGSMKPAGGASVGKGPGGAAPSRGQSSFGGGLGGSSSGNEYERQAQEALERLKQMESAGSLSEQERDALQSAKLKLIQNGISGATDKTQMWAELEKINKVLGLAPNDTNGLLTR